MKLSILGIAASGVLLASSLPAAGGTFTVINTADSGLGSLRQAIIDSNANPPPSGTTNLINFNILGSGVETITLASGLPQITQPVKIDGYSQPGASANTLAVGDNAVLLIRIDTGGNLAFVLCDAALCGGGGGSDGSTLQGLAIVSSTSASTPLSIKANNITMAGNFVGVDTDGVTLAGSFSNAVTTDSGATGTLIGGTSPAARNVIAQSASGVLIQTDGTNVTVQGNYLDTNAGGTAALGQSLDVINAGTGSNITIGGSAPGAGNVFGAWARAGIFIQAINGITVQGNLIGTNATGTAGIDTIHGQAGVVVAHATNPVLAGNVISDAGEGIIIGGFGGSPTGTHISGNMIGTDITGKAAIPNRGIGIDVSGFAITTGGVIDDMNVVAFNTAEGVRVLDSNTGWTITGNSIHSNGGLGIALGGRGDLPAVPTPNDSGDADAGPNNLQNYPVLTSVSDASGGGLNVAGSLNSTPNTTFRIEFFANDAIDPTGFGEGQTFVGSTDATTDANGDVNFSATLSNVGAKQHITATATAPDGSTSEFSAAIGQLLNISTRMEVLTGDNVLIGGFIITGNQNMNVLLRAIGPSLSQPPSNISGALADPILELHDGSGKVIATNDNWKDDASQQAQIAATGIPPTNDLESAMVQSLAPGAYTAIVRGKDSGTGIGLVEAYDLDHFATTKLANISTRGFVDTGDNVMIGGFIAANGLARVLVRGIGPSLPVSGTLADPMLELHDASGNIIASNDDWKDSQQAEIAATGIPPSNDVESALIRTLTPGNYTAIVRGKDSGTGVGQVELYNVQ